jgi:hypothetical protein
MSKKNRDITQKSFPLISETAVILGKLIVAQLDKTFPAFYRTQKFIVVFTREPATGPYPEPDESNPHFPNLGVS